MIPPLTDAVLVGCAARTLAEAAFLLVEPVARGPWPAGAVVEASLGFRGAARGRLRLVASPAFARELAANLLAVEPSSPEAAEAARAALGELANVLAGALAADWLGEAATVDFGPPTTRLGPAPAERPHRVVSFLTDEQQRLDVEVQLDG